MRLCNLNVRNFRTLESLDLSFKSHYSAICGKNDSGKTNVVRALRSFLREEDPFGFRDEQELSLKDDYPKWKSVEPKERTITVEARFIVYQDRDAGLYGFLADCLALKEKPSELNLMVAVEYTNEEPPTRVTVKAAGQDVPGLKAEQILKKLQASRIVFFHSSTEPDPRFAFGRPYVGVLHDISHEYSPQIESMKKTVNRGLARIARDEQTQLSELLGRLEEQYKVSLTLPTFDFAHMPFNITLGDRKVDVALVDWGSGTRNRTLILLALFTARQISQAAPSASKITPVFMIEEPESFLHPSAQGAFGRILQDLAAEFEIQVITTTHSPYMLNLGDPAANILLERRLAYKQQRETRLADTAGANWMEPFAEALGIRNDEFEPWRALLFAKTEDILLCEGEIDRQYLELLRDPSHGTGRLEFSGEIFPYNGRDTLKNTVLLRFVKDRYKKLFVTFDLDSENAIRPLLESLGLERNRHFAMIGLNEPGKRSIEGLLPDSIRVPVYAANPSLVQALQGTPQERKDAQHELKKLLLAEFQRRARPGGEEYKHFYSLARVINKALKE